MKWYGKEIYCTRGETVSLDFAIVNRDNTPYRISTALTNAHLLLTVKSNTYTQKDRYVLNNWINLSDFPKVDDMTILSVDELPTGVNLVKNRLLYLTTDGKYYIYDDIKLKYIEYGFRLIHTFQSDVTNDWFDKTYDYELKLISGTLLDDYVDAVNKGFDYFACPFFKIFTSFDIVKNKIYVGTNGGNC
jgi:hypothetical protein